MIDRFAEGYLVRTMSSQKFVSPGGEWLQDLVYGVHIFASEPPVMLLR